MYHIVWDYEVRADQLAAFQALYGPAGGWSQLFGPAIGYKGTELYRDTAQPMHFLTIDRWTSLAVFEAYLATIREAYDRLEEQGTMLTVWERRLGAFET
jgi:hypothetical protein